MAAQALKTSDISMPVLQRTTSSRVSTASPTPTLPLPDPLPHPHPQQQQSFDVSEDDALPAPPPELLDYNDDYHDGRDSNPNQNQSDIEQQPLPPPPPPQPAQQQPQPQHHQPQRHRPPPPPPPIQQQQLPQPSSHQQQQPHQQPQPQQPQQQPYERPPPPPPPVEPQPQHSIELEAYRLRQQQQQQQLQLQQQVQQQLQQKQQQQGHLPEKSPAIAHQLQEEEEEEATRRLQSKYASPENILPPPQPPITTNNTTTNNNNNHHKPPTDLDPVNTTHLTLAADNIDSVIGHVKKSRGTGSVSAFSDASSDISDATTSAPSATSSGSAPPSSIPAVPPVHHGATEMDLQQVDMFYRSQKTDVRVCQSLANMYLSAAKTLDRMPAGNLGQGVVGSPNGQRSSLISPNPSEMSMDDWDFIKTGIPVLVLNTGEHLRTRKLCIILAEKGTGFSLWEDELNASTRYDTPHSNFHTLSLSTDASRLVGFSFDEANAATEFSDALTSLLPRNPDDGEDGDKKKKKKKKAPKEKKPKPQKYKAPRKIDISQPCCFVHVTKLERNVMGLPPSSMFPPPPSGAELSQAMMRSRSQSSELSEYSTSPSEN